MVENGKIPPIAGPRILFVRHAKTDLNGPKGSRHDVVRGWLNPPLDAEGRREAGIVADDLKQAMILELYCCPLKRTTQTAIEIGKLQGLQPRKAKELLPWDMGDVAGMQADLARPILREFAENHPGTPIRSGESFAKWRKRFISWVRKLMRHVECKQVTVCAVTHSRCIKLLEGWIAAGMDGNKIDFDVEFKEDTSPAEVTDFRPDKNGKWDIRILENKFGKSTTSI